MVAGTRTSVPVAKVPSLIKLPRLSHAQVPRGLNVRVSLHDLIPILPPCFERRVVNKTASEHLSSVEAVPESVRRPNEP